MKVTGGQQQNQRVTGGRGVGRRRGEKKIESGNLGRTLVDDLVESTSG